MGSVCIFIGSVFVCACVAGRRGSGEGATASSAIHIISYGILVIRIIMKINRRNKLNKEKENYR